MFSGSQTAANILLDIRDLNRVTPIPAFGFLGHNPTWHRGVLDKHHAMGAAATTRGPVGEGVVGDVLLPRESTSNQSSQRSEIGCSFLPALQRANLQSLRILALSSFFSHPLLPLPKSGAVDTCISASIEKLYPSSRSVFASSMGAQGFSRWSRARPRRWVRRTRARRGSWAAL